MSEKFKKKSRIGLSAAAGLLAATGSIAPLTMATSCSEDKIKNSTIDKEYGVTRETYEDLKEQFRVEYGHRLRKLYTEESKDFKIRMDALEDDLKHFDDVVKQNTPNYTSLTNVLIDFAREQKQKYPTGNAIETQPYGIQLVRHTRTKWSDLNDLYAGMADSFKTYMHNNKMPASTITRIMAESKAKFDDLTKQLKATYGNDALAGLLKAKEKVITFFDEVNEEIALVSACLRLKDFMSEFVFDVKQYNKDGTYYLKNCLDILKNDENFQVGKILTNELMNKIFTVTRKTSGQTIKFDAKSIVPGYTIKPKLVDIEENKYTNNYSISIDFGLVKNVYDQKYANDPERLELVTGHIFDLNSDLYNKQEFDDNSTLTDILRVTEHKNVQFNLHLSPIIEKQTILDTYFNPSSKNGFISFKWDMNHQSYEAFFDNTRQDKDNSNIWTGTLSTQSLANAGLMISKDGKKYSLVNETLFEEMKDHDKGEFEQLFLQNCVVFSDVIIDETNTQNKIVSHNFKIMYGNSIYTNNDDEAVYDLVEESELKTCVNFAVSENFFNKINNKFNEVAQMVCNYSSALKETNKFSNGDDDDKSRLDILRDQAIGESIIRGYVIIANLIALTFTIKEIVTPGTLSYANKAIPILLILLSCSVFALTSYDYAIFMTKYTKPIIDYVDRANTVKKEIRESKLMLLLKQDLNDNFVLVNDDGTYDKVLFANQKAKFEKHSMLDMLNIYRKYSTINMFKQNGDNTKAQEAKYEFDMLLKEKEISSDVYNEIGKDWIPGKGFCWWGTFVVNFATIIINILITYLVVTSKKIAKKVIDAKKEVYASAIKTDVQKTKEQQMNDAIKRAVAKSLPTNERDERSHIKEDIQNYWYAWVFGKENYSGCVGPMDNNSLVIDIACKLQYSINAFYDEITDEMLNDGAIKDITEAPTRAEIIDKLIPKKIKKKPTHRIKKKQSILSFMEFIGDYFIP